MPLNIADILGPWNVAQWQRYTPTLQSVNDDASLGDGSLTGSYLVQGKTCRVMIDLTWGSTSSAGTGDVLFSYPPGVEPDFSRWPTLIVGGNPVPALPATASGSFSSSVAISANLIADTETGKTITLAPLSTLSPGQVACISVEIPIK